MLLTHMWSLKGETTENGEERLHKAILAQNPQILKTGNVHTNSKKSQQTPTRRCLEKSTSGAFSSMKGHRENIEGSKITWRIQGASGRLAGDYFFIGNFIGWRELG